MESCPRSQNSHYPKLLDVIALVKLQVLQGFQRIHGIGMFTYVIPHSSEVGDLVGDFCAHSIILVPHFFKPTT
jgi:hypothetical protein